MPRPIGNLPANARLGEQEVVPGPAVEGILPGTADEDVVPISAPESIVPGPADQHVVADPAVGGVGHRVRGQATCINLVVPGGPAKLQTVRAGSVP